MVPVFCICSSTEKLSLWFYSIAGHLNSANISNPKQNSNSSAETTMQIYVSKPFKSRLLVLAKVSVYD